MVMKQPVIDTKAKQREDICHFFLKRTYMFSAFLGGPSTDCYEKIWFSLSKKSIQSIPFPFLHQCRHRLEVPQGLQHQPSEKEKCTNTRITTGGCVWHSNSQEKKPASLVVTPLYKVAYISITCVSNSFL